MKLKRSIYNISFGILSQIIIMMIGFIVPRLFLREYGSEVNGLFSSVNQIFTYVALLEAGIGAATVQSLYKPITINDQKCISQILSATKYYYKKVSFYYLISVIILSIIYPNIINSSINKVAIAIIIVVQGLSGVINFYFQATIKQLLIAEGKNYVSYNINIIIYILSSLIKIILIINSSSIIFIQFIYFAFNSTQMIFYYWYFKKNYGWIDFKENPDYEALNQRKSFLIHQISLLIFSNTDILILSIFCDLKTASVYSIYNLVFMSLNNLMGIIYNSISFVLGHTYHEDKNKYINLHDACDNYYIALVFSIVSVCYILTTPFIKIYTFGITDIVYIDKYLPILFCLVQLLSSIRMISNNLIRIAGHMKQTIHKTMIESFINLFMSLILVKDLGIYGVLIATIVALIYRSNDIIIYSNKIILKRKSSKTYKIIIVNTILFIIIVILNRYVNINIDNYYQFAKYGLCLSLIITSIYLTINSVLNKSNFKFLLNILLKNKLNYKNI